MRYIKDRCGTTWGDAGLGQWRPLGIALNTTALVNAGVSSEGTEVVMPGCPTGFVLKTLAQRTGWPPLRSDRMKDTNPPSTDGSMCVDKSLLDANGNMAPFPGAPGVNVPGSFVPPTPGPPRPSVSSGYCDGLWSLSADAMRAIAAAAAPTSVGPDLTARAIASVVLGGEFTISYFSDQGTETTVRAFLARATLTNKAWSDASATNFGKAVVACSQLPQTSQQRKGALASECPRDYTKVASGKDIPCGGDGQRYVQAVVGDPNFASGFECQKCVTPPAGANIAIAPMAGMPTNPHHTGFALGATFARRRR